ncbi:esterase YqiA [Shewanella corallii]|uniref:Esterase YqiA n=1 Tax=Shewanella corallii TaxID=560080 RepID=A0ABT0N8H8_9GAMM|nr:YqiA/YcfP family alpha/beta fold hydrolase [Shewanella corallii]MCL2914395.1 esterase YqiA [Shewanella corallii]
MLLYIHGFNSSPQSDKGRQTADYIQQHFPHVNLIAPQLPTEPVAAMALLEQLTCDAKARGEPLCYVGSSLGGYFASYLAEKYGGRAVLINPAVKPYELFAEFIGSQHNPYTGETYQVLPQHQAQLQALDTSVIRHPDRFFVLLQSGDEVLDYRQAVSKYHCCSMCLEAGGDHSFIGYASHLSDIGQFLALSEYNNAGQRL